MGKNVSCQMRTQLRVSLLWLAVLSHSSQVWGSNQENYHLHFSTSYVSNYVRRGYSVSNNNPSTHIGVAYEDKYGIFASAWLGQVDIRNFSPYFTTRKEELYTLGYVRPITDKFFATATIVRYKYPKDILELDYDEYDITVSYASMLNVSVIRNTNALGSEERAWIYELSGALPVWQDFSFVYSYGHNDLPRVPLLNMLDDYDYWYGGLKYQRSGIQWQIAYHDASNELAEMFNSEVSVSQWVFSVVIGI